MERVRISRETLAKQGNEFSGLLGKIKAMQVRATGYLSIANFIMILYLYVVEEPLKMKWYFWVVVITIAIIIIIFIDDKILLSSETQYLWRKNKDAIVMQENVEKILHILEGKK